MISVGDTFTWVCNVFWILFVCVSFSLSYILKFVLSWYWLGLHNVFLNASFLSISEQIANRPQKIPFKFAIKPNQGTNIKFLSSWLDLVKMIYCSN